MLFPFAYVLSCACLKWTLKYRLVRMLREMRAFLTENGATFLFDTRVEGFLTQGGGTRGSIRGLKLAGGKELLADK